MNPETHTPTQGMPGDFAEAMTHATPLVGDVVEDFCTAARNWPNRIAVEYGGAALTYHALAERVRLTALRYRSGELGVDRMSGLAGVLVDHTPSLVQHLLGVLEAGATYCPIDAALPVARQRTLAEVLGVDRLVVTTRDPDEPTTVRVDALGSRNGILPTDSVAAQPLWYRSDAAYVLCTSGSMGTPKPVAISRSGLAITVRALRELFGLTPADRVLQFASLSWDTCLEEMLPTLTAGAALVFDDAARCGSFGPFLRMLSERGVTVLDLPTSFWHELVLFLSEERMTLPDSVRLVVIGGERIDPTRLQQWRELDVERVRLLNTYGCTETTMITHAVQLSGPGTEAAIAAEGAELPIGRPLSHVHDHVTADGELLVSGPGVAIGYLGLPDTTASAFSTADHGSGPQRWFGTGDLATRGEDGLIYSQGRMDETVKVLGARVHPAEVEVHLNAHPAVKGAVVVAERSLGRTALTAYVVVTTQTTAAALRCYLRERLPSQFVPTRVTFVEALARTPSGKIDRAATRRAAMDSDREGIRQ